MLLFLKSLFAMSEAWFWVLGITQWTQQIKSLSCANFYILLGRKETAPNEYNKWIIQCFGDCKVLWNRNCTRMGSIQTSLVAQMANNLPEMQKTWVQSLGQKDPLEKRMATHPSILAWRIPWTEEPGVTQSMESQRVRHYWATNTHKHTQTHRRSI